jgi:hypothetical protein
MNQKTGQGLVRSGELRDGDRLLCVASFGCYGLERGNIYTVESGCITTREAKVSLSWFSVSTFEKVTDRTGREWLNSGELRVGDTLIATVSSERFSIRVNEEFKVTKNYREELSIVTRFLTVALHRLNITTFKRKATMTLDWNRPLFVEKFSNPQVTKVGTAKDGLVVIENCQGNLYKANPATGVLTLDPGLVVTNRDEPWRQAYNRFSGNWNHKTQETWFREIFELGRTWKQD